MKITDIYRNNNLHIQVANYTCGPVSLLNILRMKGDASYSEDELAVICKAVPGKGTTNDNMVAAAKKIGLEVIETKANSQISDIERHIDNGDYVIINYFEAFSEDGHYSIAAEYDDKALYIADCYDGLIRIEKKYFPKWWHNSDNTIQGWFMAVK